MTGYYVLVVMQMLFYFDRGMLHHIIFYLETLLSFSKEKLYFYKNFYMIMKDEYAEK